MRPCRSLGRAVAARAFAQPPATSAAASLASYSGCCPRRFLSDALLRASAPADADVNADGSVGDGEVENAGVAVQRRAAPAGVPSVKATEGRHARSVGELHALHCQKLAAKANTHGRGGDAAGGASPPRPRRSTADTEWEWAGLRACKLAEQMRPRDLATCAAAFAEAERRDMRALFVLAETAIGLRAEFFAEDCARMLDAYATLRVRNEPLCDALGGRVLALALAAAEVSDTGASSSVVDASAPPPTRGELELTLRAHELLGLQALPACDGLAAALEAAELPLEADA